MLPKGGGQKAEKKNCKSGFPCGYSCISKSKNCKSPIGQQAKTYADWLSGQSASSSASSPEAPKKTRTPKAEPKAEGKPIEQPKPKTSDSQAGTPSPAKKDVAKSPQIPDGAVVKRKGDLTSYSYVIDGKKLSVTFERRSEGKVEVNFKVNGSYLTGKAGNPRTGVAILSKVRSTVRYYAETEKPSQFFTTPAANDRLGDRRSELYSKFGFKPSPDFEGDMYAIVKDGQIVK